MIKPVKEFMEAAIKEAIKAKEQGDYAIGAVVVKDNKIIACAGCRLKTDSDPTHHAEVVVIRQAAKIFGTRHIEGCILYTTLEPCPMCASAAIWAKMKGIVYGANIKDMAEYSLKSANTDFSWRVIDIPASTILDKGDPKLFIVGEFMREECKKLFHS